ncbi:MAG: hypothetical protein F4227_05750 [Gammaproteobacteria bacterium]|nr:hypothetical protein [Gammaproteobacteria bacterium]MYF02470.1 hypothetical protein [Gammaproteobacteria bacterium]MYI77881.1 hypothetical protein [Gammaproteobacteria bacterium]
MFAHGITDCIAALAFLVSYFFFFDQDIYWAAVLFIIVLAVQFLIIHRVFNWKISNLMWVALGVGMTTVLVAMLFQHPDAIKWRPTVILWTISAVCFLALALGRKKVLQWILGKWMIFVESFWSGVCVVFALTYLLAGITNLVVAYVFSEQMWVIFVAFAWIVWHWIGSAVIRIVMPFMGKKIENEVIEMEADLPESE